MADAFDLAWDAGPIDMSPPQFEEGRVVIASAPAAPQIDPFDAAWDSVEAPRTWGNTALDAGNSLMKGVYGVGEFAQSLTPMGIGNQLAAAVTGIPSYQQQAEGERLSTFGDPELNGANLAERAALRGVEMAPYAIMGGGIAPAFSSGVGMELAKALGAPEWVGGIIGGVVPGAARGLASKTARAIGGKDFADEAKSLQQQAIGARYNDYLKSAKSDYFDPTVAADDVETTLRKDIQEIIDRGTFAGVLDDPKELFKANQKELIAEAKDLNRVLGAADRALKSSGARVTLKPSDFSNTMAHIESAPANQQDDLVKYLDDYISSVAEKSDGSLDYLQRQKQAIQKKVYTGKDAGREIVDKYIASDLRKKIEEYAPDAAEINRKIGQHLGLEPILRRGVASEEGSSAASKLLQAERTSGGSLTGPTLKGAALGAGIGGSVFPGGAAPGAVIGGGLGMGYGAALGYLNSPSGKFATAAALRAADPFRKAGSSLADVLGARATLGNFAAASAIPLESRQSSEKSQQKTAPRPATSGKPLEDRRQPTQGRKESRADNSPSPKPTATPSSQSNINQVKAIFDQQPKLIQAVMKVESEGKKNALSSKGAQGLMQLMPGTAKDMGVTDAFDPAQNVEGGKRYLGKMLTKYGDRDLALAAYNYGPGNLDRLMQRTGKKSFEAIRSYLPKETQLYVSKIRALMKRKTIELEV